MFDLFMLVDICPITMLFYNQWGNRLWRNFQHCIYTIFSILRRFLYFLRCIENTESLFWIKE